MLLVVLEAFCSVAAVTVVNLHSVLDVLLFILGLYIWKLEVIAYVSSLKQGMIACLDIFYN